MNGFLLGCFILSFIMYGAMASRQHGTVMVNRVIRNTTWVVPLIAVMALVLSHHGVLIMDECLVPAWVQQAGMGLALGALCWVGKTTGHGLYMNLGTYYRYAGSEKVDFLLKPFFGVDIRTLDRTKNMMPFDIQAEQPYKKVLLRCVAGLAVVGFLAVSGVVIAFGYIEPLAALPVAICGAMKGAAYMIGWQIADDEWAEPSPTNYGEFFTGLFAYAGIAIGTLIIMV